MRDTNKSEPATKGDLIDGLAALKAGLSGELKGAINAVEQKLTGKIDSVETGLNAKISNVYLEVVKLQSRVGNIEEKMSTKDDISRVLNAIDKFAAVTENYKRKDQERGHMLIDQSDKISNHETRITLLETVN